MTKKIRNTKHINFDNLKVLAFTSGYTELLEFLQNAKLKFNKELKLTDIDKDTAKIIRKQANEFGYKVSIASYAYGNNIQHRTRDVTIGQYY